MMTTSDDINIVIVQVLDYSDGEVMINEERRNTNEYENGMNLLKKVG